MPVPGKTSKITQTMHCASLINHINQLIRSIVYWNCNSLLAIKMGIISSTKVECVLFDITAHSGMSTCTFVVAEMIEHILASSSNSHQAY